MADTIINTPPATTESNSGSGLGLMLGLIILAVLAFLVFFYGLPALRNIGTAPSSNVNLEVPKQVDVNVNSGE